MREPLPGLLRAAAWTAHEKLAAMVTAAAVVGSVIGGRLTSYVQPATLRKAFGWFVLVMASVVLAEEVDLRVGSAVAAATAVAAGMSVACNRYAHCPLRRVLARRTAAAAR